MMLSHEYMLAVAGRRAGRAFDSQVCAEALCSLWSSATGNAFVLGSVRREVGLGRGTGSHFPIGPGRATDLMHGDEEVGTRRRRRRGNGEGVQDFGT